jgi:hypothetical protein
MSVDIAAMNEPTVEPAIVKQARSHGDRRALSASDGEWTYRELVVASGTVADRLLAGRHDLAEARGGFRCRPAGCTWPRCGASGRLAAWWLP